MRGEYTIYRNAKTSGGTNNSLLFLPQYKNGA